MYHVVFLSNHDMEWTNEIHDFTAVTFSVKFNIVNEKLTLP